MREDLEDKMGGPSNFTVHRAGEPFTWESVVGNQGPGGGIGKHFLVSLAGKTCIPFKH